MSNHQVGLASILVAVAIAGVIVGYALAGVSADAPLSRAQEADARPLLQAIATSVAPGEPIPSPTPRLVERLPACHDPAVRAGELCAPIKTQFRPCEQYDYVPDVAEAAPCTKP